MENEKMTIGEIYFYAVDEENGKIGISLNIPREMIDDENMNRLEEATNLFNEIISDIFK